MNKFRLVIVREDGEVCAKLFKAPNLRYPLCVGSVETVADIFLGLMGEPTEGVSFETNLEYN
jgi:hypothetical protein